jgi:hypothetical protein
MRVTPNQVAKVTKELRALSVQLHWSAFQGFSPSDQNLILNELLNAGLIEDLRTTVDQLSHLLWCYVESAATTSDPEPDYEMQSRRLGKITEMLRVLHRPARPAEDPLAFVERLTQYVDRHLETAGQNAGTLGACVAVPAVEPEPDATPKSSSRDDAIVSIQGPHRFERALCTGRRLAPSSLR